MSLGLCRVRGAWVTCRDGEIDKDGAVRCGAILCASRGAAAVLWATDRCFKNALEVPLTYHATRTDTTKMGIGRAREF